MPKRRKGELYTFTVEGAGEFPFDMLRYDACWPYSEGRDSTELSSESHFSFRRRVVLQSQQESGPTPGRWQSFGWRFVGEGELRDTTVHPTPTRGMIARRGT